MTTAPATPLARRAASARPAAAAALAALVLGAGAGCPSSSSGDGSATLERGLTTPIADLAATAAPVGAPAGGFGADGPSGLAVVAGDDGADAPQALEDADLLVCDPANDRVVLLKARDRHAARAVDFNQGALEAPRAVAVTADRRAVIAVEGGFAVLDATGAAVGAARAIRAGAAYEAIALASLHAHGGGVVQAIFLAGPDGIDRVLVDEALEPTGPPATLAPGLAARGLALRGGDLLLTAGRSLRVVRGALGAAAGAAAEELFAFALCCTPAGIALNSAGRVVVAVAVPGGGPHQHRLEEIDLGPPARTHSVLHLPAPPRAVATDGLRASFAWTSATAVTQQLHFAPDLGRHVFPIIERRGCASCHAPGTGVEPHDLDLSTAVAAHDTTFDTASVCMTGAGAAKRVAEAHASGSALIEKLEGTGCGDRMLEGTRPLPAIEIDTIRGWIDAGGFIEGHDHGPVHGGH